MIIEDGTGGGHKAAVTSENLLRTYSVIEHEITHTSEDEGDAYAWTASVDLGADKNLIWLRNDSTDKTLMIHCMSISASAASMFEIWVGTGATASGTEVVGVNLNRASNRAAEATCRHTETSKDAGSGMTLLASHHIPATETTHMAFYGALILGYYDEIAVNVITDIALSTVNICGYFHS